MHRHTHRRYPFSWVFVAPRATLVGDNGQVIGTHFGEPTWEARDGSKATGAVTGRDPNPLPPEATNIQQLLLKATPTPVGPDGGRLGATTFIQRVATTGGVAPPAAQCNAETANNPQAAQVDVPYTADYYFWKATGS
jgi:Protein of unknown function (DUF3455)